MPERVTYSRVVSKDLIQSPQKSMQKLPLTLVGSGSIPKVLGTLFCVQVFINAKYSAPQIPETRKCKHQQWINMQANLFWLLVSVQTQS